MPVELILEELVLQQLYLRARCAEHFRRYTDVGVAEIFGHQREMQTAKTLVAVASQHVGQDTEGRLPAIGDGDVLSCDAPAVVGLQPFGQHFTDQQVSLGSLVTTEHRVALSGIRKNRLQRALEQTL